MSLRRLYEPRTPATQDIPAISRLCRERGVVLHCDATQAVGKIPISLREWEVDFFALSGHKFHAPKGVGALYIREGVLLEPFIIGGGIRWKDDDLKYLLGSIPIGK